MIKLLKNLRPIEWFLMFGCLIFIVCQVWLDLEMPEYMGEITTLVQTPGSLMSDILKAGGMMLLLTIGSIATSIVVAIIAAKIATDFSARLRLQVFDKVQSFSMEEINKFSIASLITRSTNDINQVQMFFVMGMQILIKSPILAVWAIAKIIDKGWQWSAATGIAIGILLIVAGIFIAIVMPKFRRIQNETDELNRMARENLTGLKVVRAYNAENYQEAKFHKVNKQLTKTNLFTNKIMYCMMPSIDLIMNGLMLAIYWIGAVLIANAGMDDKVILFSNMMVFVLYAMQLLMAFMMLVIIYLYLPRASVSGKRVNEVLNTPLRLVDGNIVCGDDKLVGEVEFINVSFKYPDAQDYVLKNINFVAKKGETVAFIGATGCGKSTIVNLIPRFYDVTEGVILVDGINIKDYPQKALRNKLGYVSQQAKLFSGTINTNVSFGIASDGKPSGDNVHEAVKIAQAKDFVENLDQGYDSRVAQGGKNLSGGQKQRISIARALARKPEILIFDDSFSALDYKTDRILRSALKKDATGTTALIVAQRIGTIKDADKIVVVEDGEIVGMGSHSELMNTCEVYKEIAYSQLSKEELE